MNISKETNANLRINEVSENDLFRIVRGKLESISSNRNHYLAQVCHDGENWEMLNYFREDKKERHPAVFNSFKKAKRFLRKLLIGNNIIIPDEYNLKENE